MSRSRKLIAFSLVSALTFSTWGCVAQDAGAIYRQRLEEREKQYAAEPHYSARYDIMLVSVDRPAQAKELYGDMSLSKAQTPDASLNIAEDQLVKIVWLPPDRELSLELLNKTGQSLKIPWDESAYVDISSHSHRVVHSGVKFSDRNSSQPPSIVPSKGRLADFLYPSDLISYVPGQYGGWAQPLMFPCVKPRYVCESNHRQLASAHKGLTYRVLLPLQVGTDIYNYTFTFKVNNVEIVSDKKEDPEKNTSRVTP